MEATSLNVSNVDIQDHGLESTQNQIEGGIDQDDVLESLDLAVSLLADCKADLSLENLDTVIFLFHEVLEICPVSHPLHYNVMCSLASAMGVRFLTKNEQADFELFEELGKKIITTTSAGMDHVSDEDDSDIIEMVEVAKTLLELEFHNSTSMSTIESTIFFAEQSLPLLSSNHPKRSLALKTLAYGLCIRFNSSNRIADLKNAIFHLRENQQTYAKGRWQEPDSFQINKDESSLDLRNTLSAASQSRGSTPTEEEQDEDVSLLEFGMELAQNFATSGKMDDLDQGIALMQQGLTEISMGNPNYAVGLNSIANKLVIRFKQRGESQDLDEAISFHTQALELFPPPHPHRSNALNNFANALVARFEHRGESLDLDQAISFYRQALELFPPNRSLSLNNLANALKTRFEHRGESVDLDEAISFSRQALELTPPPHPHRSTSLNNLANALFTGFVHRGESVDLDEAISFHRQALELTPPPHPHRSECLNNLANALVTRFEHRGESVDLDQAISFHRQALELTPPPHPNHSGSLNNLASALTIRFKQRGERLDLDQAVSFFRRALKLFPPSHPQRSECLDNLANALRSRFEHQGESVDLDEAISFHRQALELTPPAHPHRSMSFNNLASSLRIRFEQQGEHVDLDQAISFLSQALKFLPLGHPHQSPSLGNFGMLHMSAYKRLGSDQSHLEQAMLLFSQATHPVSLSPSRRFDAATRWARQADLHQHHSALEAYNAVLDVLPQLAALGLDIQSRQDALTTGTDGVARKAAKCAIRARSFDKALEYLETGRGVFWSQFLHLRSPFDQLADHSPELTKQLHRISSELERGSHRDMSRSISDNRKRLSLEEEAQYFERLSREWSEVLDQVRKLKGFEDFLLPRRLSILQTAAKQRPIVYLVANDDNSDCLIVTSTSVHHISLPELPSTMLSSLVKLIQIAASDSLIPRSLIKELVENEPAFSPNVFEILQFSMDSEEERGMRRHNHLPAYISSDDIFRDVLAFLWDQAVKPVIDFMNLQKSDTPPTLMWCPTGLFTFLPIHAAGRYKDGLVDCASDYIVSSYTPTVGALLTKDPIPSTEPFKMLAVIQSRSLPSTIRELKKIEQYATGDSLIKFGVPGAPASVDAVASSLSGASIVHFACHGNQDSSRPLDSGLQIEDEVLTISRIMKESVPNGSLAFLSACETAKGDEKVPDEAMSIAASLLFSGFRSVVATMWRMWDEDGPVVTDAFYRELFRGPDGVPMPRPDMRKSAQALHIAVKELRSQGVPFKRWVPFIHMGK